MIYVNLKNGLDTPEGCYCLKAQWSQQQIPLHAFKTAMTDVLVFQGCPDCVLGSGIPLFPSSLNQHN